MEAQFRERPASGEREQSGEAGRSHSQRARVLVIEDDATVTEVVARYLEREGYEVLTARDGPTGVHRALSASPDLIVLDLMLPGIDGFEVCSQVREVAPVP